MNSNAKFVSQLSGQFFFMGSIKSTSVKKVCINPLNYFKMQTLNLLISNKGPFINYVDRQGGRGDSSNVNTCQRGGRGDQRLVNVDKF